MIPFLTGSAFRAVSYGGTTFQQSFQLTTWSNALNLCRSCGGIANVDASTVLNERNQSTIQLWIGSFNGGDIISNLVWFTRTGQIVVVMDGQARPALCNGPQTPQPVPQPSPQPVPQPSPAPPPQATPKPTPQPSPQPAPTPSCPPCPVCPPTPQPTPQPSPAPQPTPQPSPHPTPTHHPPTPTPTPLPIPTPTPSACIFQSVTYNGTPYRQSVGLYATWRLGRAACKTCFNSELADIFNANSTGTNQLWIGSYQGAPITESLVWFQATARISVVLDNTARRALCED